MVEEKKAFTNPLSLGFGQALKKLRGATQSSTIAQVLNVSNSFIRLLETASANINTSRTLKLINAFPEIEFQPLCKLLAIISITDTGTGSITDYRNVITDVRSASKEDDYYLDIILTQVLELIKTNPHTSPETELPQDFIKGIVTYLTTPTVRVDDINYEENKHAHTQTDKYIGDHHDLAFDKLVNNSPSIYLDTFSLSLRSLSTINANLFAQDSSAWEKENAKNFQKLIAVIADFNDVLKTDNIEKYDHSFLLRDNFQELNYIILNDDRPAETYKKEFEKELRQRWKSGPGSMDAKNLERYFSKINIRTAKQGNKQIQTLLQSKEDKQHDVLWIFITVQGIKVGFSLRQSNNVENELIGETLSYHNAKRKYRLFTDVWDTLIDK